MTRLSVNLNKVALLRNTRTIGIPNVVRAATIALHAGAHGITVHPRPDERHIRAGDVHDIAALMKRYPHAEYNIEGNPFENLLAFARAVRPHQCTLVPDGPAQFTSDHGWDLARDGARMAPVIAELKSLGIRVSLFMDPIADAMPAAARLGADRVELYTESYARMFNSDQEKSVLKQYVASSSAARDAGLGVNAGHDLNQTNLPPFLAALGGVDEVSIGHALIADALETGLETTVRNYLAAVRAGDTVRA